jgi:hypothetical protein
VPEPLGADQQEQRERQKLEQAIQLPEQTVSKCHRQPVVRPERGEPRLHPQREERQVSDLGQSEPPERSPWEDLPEPLVFWALPKDLWKEPS